MCAGGRATFQSFLFFRLHKTIKDIDLTSGHAVMHVDVKSTASGKHCSPENRYPAQTLLRNVV